MNQSHRQAQSYKSNSVVPSSVISSARSAQTTNQHTKRTSKQPNPQAKKQKKKTVPHSVDTSSTKTLKKQMFGKQSKNVKIQADDKRFEFLMRTPLPTVKEHFDIAKKAIISLINADKFHAARSFALDAFSNYRIQVMSYVYRIKGESIKLCENSTKVPPFILATVVFEIFNTAQQRLEAYHENQMKRFQKFDDELIKQHPNQYKQNRDKIIVKLRRSLKKYENIVRKTKGIFRSSLAFL